LLYSRAMKNVVISEEDLYNSLSKESEILSKYSYLGEGAKYWDALSKKWSMLNINTSDENTLIKKNLDNAIASVIQRGVKGINIIDIGCGNGLTAKDILQEILEQNVQVTYTAVDISKEMASLAKNNIDKKIKAISTEVYIMDFEKDDLTKLREGLKPYYINLVMILGNTLGNYKDPSKILNNVMQLASKSDLILIGLANYQPDIKDSLLISYSLKEELKLVCSTAKRIGIRLSDPSVSWNEKNQEVEIKAKTKQTLRIHHNNKDTIIESGSEILLLRSRRFTDELIKKVISNSLLSNRHYKTYKGLSNSLVLIGN